MLGLKALTVAMVLAVGLAASSAMGTSPAVAHSPQVLEFGTMVGVTGPYVGTTNPIRGVNGGGLPWSLSSATGELSANGHLEIVVRGLVLAAGANTGKNPVANFKAIVSCQTISGGSPAVVNVATGLFPASLAGNASIEAQVALPSPCIAPIVFVTSPGGAWFAATGK